MELFKRIFFVAMFAGIVAGLVQASIMQWRVVPLILEAETYEVSQTHAVDHEADATPVAPHKHEMNMQDWEPQDGFERIFYTVLSTILASLGFAFIIGAISVIFSIPITSSNGLIWGLAGFLSFSLMPAIGLPPELPGMIAAVLSERQIWWWGTVIASGSAILLIVKIPKPLSYIAALIIFLMPHIIGAPAPLTLESDVPAYLATLYAANVLFTSLVFWLVLATIYSFFFKKFQTV